MSRSNLIKIRVDDAEKAMIEEAAGDQSASTWARGILLDRAKREIEGVLTAYVQHVPPVAQPKAKTTSTIVPRAPAPGGVDFLDNGRIKAQGGMLMSTPESVPGLKAVLSKLPSAPVVDLTKPQTKPRK